MTTSCLQLKVEELEKSGVCHHDDAIFVFAVLHLLPTILDFSPNTHHTAFLLYLRTHILDFLCCLRPHGETRLIAHQADTVGMLVPTVDTVLAPGVVAQQDDKH